MHYPFSLAAPVGSINAALRGLGATLKAARIGRGNSVRRQATRAGVSPDAVERIERGACTVGFGEVIALCISLGIRPELKLPAAESSGESDSGLAGEIASRCAASNSSLQGARPAQAA